MGIERLLVLPAFEEDDPTGVDRVAGERVVQAPLLLSGRAHGVVTRRDERVTLGRFDTEGPTYYEHGPMMAPMSPEGSPEPPTARRLRTGRHST